MRLTSHCRAESRAGTPCNSFCFPQRCAKSPRARVRRIAVSAD
jgi:hypothetical protein